MNQLMLGSWMEQMDQQVLKVYLGKTQLLIMNRTGSKGSKGKMGYLADPDIENHAFEGEDEIQNGRNNKVTIDPKIDISDSIDTESLKSNLFDESRKGKLTVTKINLILIGSSSEDKGITKTPDSKSNG